MSKAEGEQRLSSLERIRRREAEEERRRIYWRKDVEDGASRQEERGIPRMSVARENVKMIGVTGEEAALPGEMEVYREQPKVKEEEEEAC